MKKTIMYASLATLIAGTAVAGTAYARGGFGHGFGPGGFSDGSAQVERMIRVLDLDDAQRTEVRAIVDEARPQGRELGDSLRDARERFGELVKSDTLDTAELQSLADAQGDAIAAAMVTRAQVMHEIRGVLNADQLEQLDEMLEKRGQRGRGGRNR